MNKMAMLLMLTVALLASAASARTLSAPVHSFSSMEADPHHRSARGAEACDCADNADLVGQIVETAPSIEDAAVDEAPVQQHHRVAQAVEFVESPDERISADLALASDDAHLDDDQEATLCEGGLDPADEAAVEPCAGRPARQTAAVGTSVSTQQGTAQANLGADSGTGDEGNSGDDDEVAA